MATQSLIHSFVHPLIPQFISLFIDSLIHGDFNHLLTPDSGHLHSNLHAELFLKTALFLASSDKLDHEGLAHILNYTIVIQTPTLIINETGCSAAKHNEGTTDIDGRRTTIAGYACIAGFRFQGRSRSIVIGYGKCA